MIIPLDLTEEERYTEMVHKSDEVDNLYKICTQDEYWINPMTGNGHLGKGLMSTSPAQKGN